MDYSLIITQIEGTEKEISDYFVVLQNQEKLKAGEIINAFNGKDLYQIFHKENFIKKFVEIFNFEDLRQDLIKFLAFIILINQDKISLGDSDKKLINKMKDFDIKNLNKDINFFEKIKKLSREVNNITINKDIFKDEKSSKNALKIFLLSYFFSNSNYYNNLNLIEKMKISRKIAKETKQFKSMNESKKNELSNNKYWKNIEKIEKILVRSHNKKEIIKVINNNFDKLFEGKEFNNYSKELQNNYVNY